MTKPEIIAKLTELGIAHDPAANKPVLEALLPADAPVPAAVAAPVVTEPEADVVPASEPVAVAKGGIKLEDITADKKGDNEEQTRLRSVFAAAFVQSPAKAADEDFKQDLLNQIARAGVTE